MAPAEWGTGDDPAAEQALADATRLLSLAMSRAALGRDELTAHYERLAERLPADHPLAPYAASMGRVVRYVQAIRRGDTERADATMTAMIRSAGQVPAGHPLRPFMLCGIAAACAQRHSMTGEPRQLELAKAAIDAAIEDLEQAAGPGLAALLAAARALRADLTEAGG